MAMDPLILIANPGSASRKYALFAGNKCLAKLHFEYEAGKIVCGFDIGGQIGQEPSPISHLSFAASQVGEILKKHGLINDGQSIGLIALRVVAPGRDLQKDLVLDERAINKLAELEPRAPLHINATLQEAHLLKKTFADARLLGISDSAFHSTLPVYAKSYGLPPQTVQKLDISRFGYQGLSVESAVAGLHQSDNLPKRLVVCHLGSGSSVTAVKNGKSVDTTMGYSPLEGLVMSTRSGSIDIVAAQVIKKELSMSDAELVDYLNQKSGLLGISGKSADIRELLELERGADEAAGLALKMYVYKVSQAIGQMSAALGGLDALVFTGTVGERSAVVRQRIIQGLAFLGLQLDTAKNQQCRQPAELTLISPGSHPAKVYVIPSDEYGVMAKHAIALA